MNSIIRNANLLKIPLLKRNISALNLTTVTQKFTVDTHDDRNKPRKCTFKCVQPLLTEKSIRNLRTQLFPSHSRIIFKTNYKLRREYSQKFNKNGEHFKNTDNEKHGESSGEKFIIIKDGRISKHSEEEQVGAEDQEQFVDKLLENDDYDPGLHENTEPGPELKQVVDINNKIHQETKERRELDRHAVNKLKFPVVKNTTCSKMKEKEVVPGKTLRTPTLPKFNPNKRSYTATKKIYPKHELKKKEFRKDHCQKTEESQRSMYPYFIDKLREAEAKKKMKNEEQNFPYIKIKKKESMPLFMIVKGMSERSKTAPKNLDYKASSSSTCFKVNKPSKSDSSLAASKYMSSHVDKSTKQRKHSSEREIKKAPSKSVSVPENFFFTPEKYKGRIINFYSLNSRNLTVDSDYKDKLTKTIRYLLQPVIEREYMKYDELKTVLERMEKNFDAYFRDPNSTSRTYLYKSISPHKDCSATAFNGNVQEIQDPSIKQEIKDPVELKVEKQEPLKNAETTLPSLKKDKIQEPKKNYVLIAKHGNTMETRMMSSFKNDDPNNKKNPCKIGDGDPCKEKEPCDKKNEDEIKKQPCEENDNSNKKEDPCKNKEEKKKTTDPCEKNKEDPCKKKDPCEKKKDPGEKKKDPCEKKEDPCKKKEDPCKKKDPCNEKDPCEKVDSNKNDDPCKKKEDPCKKKDPCEKEDPCKADCFSNATKSEPCESELPCPDTFKTTKSKFASFQNTCNEEESEKVCEQGSADPFKKIAPKSSSFVPPPDAPEEVNPDRVTFKATKSKASSFVASEDVSNVTCEKETGLFKRAKSKTCTFVDPMEKGEDCKRKRMPCIDPCKKQHPCSLKEKEKYVSDVSKRKPEIGRSKQTVPREKLQKSCSTDYPKPPPAPPRPPPLAPPPPPLKPCPPPPASECRYCKKPKQEIEEPVVPVPRPTVCKEYKQPPPPPPKRIEPQQYLKQNWKPVKLKATSSKVIKHQSKSESVMCKPEKHESKKYNSQQPHSKMDDSRKGFLDGCKGLLANVCKMFCPGKFGSRKKGATIGTSASQSMPELRNYSHYQTTDRSEVKTKKKAFRERYPWKIEKTPKRCYLLPETINEDHKRDLVPEQDDVPEPETFVTEKFLEPKIEEKFLERKETFLDVKVKDAFHPVEERDVESFVPNISFREMEEKWRRLRRPRQIPKKTVIKRPCLKTMVLGDSHKRNKSTGVRMYSSEGNDKHRVFNGKRNEEKEKSSDNEEVKTDGGCDQTAALDDCTKEYLITKLYMQKKNKTTELIMEEEEHNRFKAIVKRHEEQYEKRMKKEDPEDICKKEERFNKYRQDTNPQADLSKLAHRSLDDSKMMKSVRSDLFNENVEDKNKIIDYAKDRKQPVIRRQDEVCSKKTKRLNATTQKIETDRKVDCTTESTQPIVKRQDEMHFKTKKEQNACKSTSKAEDTNNKNSSLTESGESKVKKQDETCFKARSKETFLKTKNTESKKKKFTSKSNKKNIDCFKKVRLNVVEKRKEKCTSETEGRNDKKDFKKEPNEPIVDEQDQICLKSCSKDIKKKPTTCETTPGIEDMNKSKKIIKSQYQLCSKDSEDESECKTDKSSLRKVPEQCEPKKADANEFMKLTMKNEKVDCPKEIQQLASKRQERSCKTELRTEKTTKKEDYTGSKQSSITRQNEICSKPSSKDTKNLEDVSKTSSKNEDNIKKEDCKQKSTKEQKESRKQDICKTTSNIETKDKEKDCANICSKTDSKETKKQNEVCKVANDDKVNKVNFMQDLVKKLTKKYQKTDSKQSGKQDICDETLKSEKNNKTEKYAASTKQSSHKSQDDECSKTSSKETKKHKEVHEKTSDDKINKVNYKQDLSCQKTDSKQSEKQDTCKDISKLEIKNKKEKCAKSTEQYSDKGQDDVCSKTSSKETPKSDDKMKKADCKQQSAKVQNEIFSKEALKSDNQAKRVRYMDGDKQNTVEKQDETCSKPSNDQNQFKAFKPPLKKMAKVCQTSNENEGQMEHKTNKSVTLQKQESCEAEAKVPEKDKLCTPGKTIEDIEKKGACVEVNDQDLGKQCSEMCKKPSRVIKIPYKQPEKEEKAFDPNLFICEVKKIGKGEQLICKPMEKPKPLCELSKEEEPKRNPSVERLLKCKVIRDDCNREILICKEIKMRDEEETAEKQVEEQTRIIKKERTCPKKHAKKVVSHLVANRKLVCKEEIVPSGDKDMCCKVVEVQEIKTDGQEPQKKKKSVLCKIPSPFTYQDLLKRSEEVRKQTEAELAKQNDKKPSIMCQCNTLFFLKFADCDDSSEDGDEIETIKKKPFRARYPWKVPEGGAKGSTLLVTPEERTEENHQEEEDEKFLNMKQSDAIRKQAAICEPSNSNIKIEEETYSEEHSEFDKERKVAQVCQQRKRKAPVRELYKNVNVIEEDKESDNEENKESDNEESDDEDIDDEESGDEAEKVSRKAERKKEDETSTKGKGLLTYEVQKVGACERLMSKSQEVSDSKCEENEKKKYTVIKILKCKMAKTAFGKDVLVCKEIIHGDECEDQEAYKQVEEEIKSIEEEATNNCAKKHKKNSKEMQVAKKLVCNEEINPDTNKKEMRCQVLEVKIIKGDGQKNNSKCFKSDKKTSPFTYKDLLRKSEEVRKDTEKELKSKDGKC